ncbi:CheY-like chemotaxis protein/signal transduction histidine kinase/HAMP domain-containing protein [Povalibacter uvarum]|uniref:histidine kinase n=1 Tax=Povalibacter uvarum TaxID=732238 RepID=A0A841HJF7_9GAMM|nr:response regulator [Povalibacter uvarum]MBB6093167.1 CheY-like chemotaxis protein/signal transduction histidine kinase/HAMP domain-containing protein [Povalibacter uvarum]
MVLAANDAANLQRRDILKALRALKRGDFSVRLPDDLSDIDGEIASTFNEVVELNDSMAREFERLSAMVGRDGKLSERAKLHGATGSWANCVDSINGLVSDMAFPLSEVARVIGAVAKGNLSQAVNLEIDGRPMRGEYLRISTVVNTMVDQLNSFASEVTRVAREVGTEGKLGGQANVRGVAGTWKDLTDSVNHMAANLTGQVRNIAEVTTAVASGNLSKKITVDVKGEILELKNTINTMVDQLNSFASEVTRVAREVGTEGKLGGQAKVEGVGGTWKDLTDNVNLMAANLTGQVRNIAEVTTAVASGNLSKKITVDVKGEILELKNTINVMVDQLNSFASEVTRVAREVGTEGKLGGQARVEGVAGTWKDLTDNVNLMAANLTGQVRNIADVTTAVASGNLSKKITVDVKGEILELKNTINTMVDQLNSFASEVTRVAREVGTEGKLGGQANVKGVAGTWKDLTDNVNLMAANLTGQVRNIADVTTAVASGNLSKKVTVDVKGEILELKNTVNVMVDQLNSFASEVTRVAREVGTEGKLGGQARVEGVGGTWKDLTDNVNLMAANLTGQVRGIAEVVTGVANGDLTRKLVVEAKGEIAALANTINGMIGTLATFADQVTNVAREVGTEGALGGQASVPGAAGLWRDLTDNVNQLAANLTTQVRAIAEVATAVTKGDLTRFITVEASGEVAALKDNINEMIRNLKDTTQKNTEQDWLKTNIARFTRLLQGQRDIRHVSNLILSQLVPLVNAQQALFYLTRPTEQGTVLELVASYAAPHRPRPPQRLHLGDGLIGQCAVEKRSMLLNDAPHAYMHISSGLGHSKPISLIVLPALFEGEVKAVLELGSFERFSTIHTLFLDQLMESIGIVLNTLAANMQTEALLAQSQLLTRELQSQQDELKNTNDRLEQQATTLQRSEDMLRSQQEELRAKNEELVEKANLLSWQNKQVEAKNQEVERAKELLEEKAEQLALTSKYKSEFLANMSHELRTPLNSLLILSKLLADNADSNLTGKQIEFAQTINRAGTELLALINDILDLSKIESGTVTLDVGTVEFAEVVDNLQRGFEQIASNRKLSFRIEIDSTLPPAMTTDEKRLQQILKNLLSNAFKFTHEGGVELSIQRARSGWNPANSVLSNASAVVAYSVTDTGIGIPSDKLRVIFEAFQQADGTTSRKYGGTGLGLSISREICRMLGGEITVASTPNHGSSFTLYLPLMFDMAWKPATHVVHSQPAPVVQPVAIADSAPLLIAAELTDDRQSIAQGDPVLLIIEDDVKFAQILVDLAHDRGFKAVVSSTGSGALPLVRRFNPSLITLDIRLPDMDGWRLLDILKRTAETRHIPIHIISVQDPRERGTQMGAFSVLEKPVDRAMLQQALGRTEEFLARPTKELLLIEDDDLQYSEIAKLIGNGDVQLTRVCTGREALEVLQTRTFDCVVLDLVLPDMDGVSLIEVIRRDPAQRLPVIIHTAKDLSPEDEAKLRKLAESFITKGPESPQQLFDETALFLHREVENMPPEQRRIIERARRREPGLAGRKVLIVDDDIRNIFSLTGVLEQHDIQVLHAENGRDGIDMLEDAPDIDMVLMDVMMPDMDGYETMRQIRSREQFRKLPMIAITAKAMKGDREKCIEAGASEYLSKPVDVDQLVSMMRVWLRRV